MLKKISVKKFLAFCLCLAFTPYIHAFNDISHKYVTKTSLESFTKPSENLKSKCNEDFNLASEFWENDAKKYKELLINYSVQPDIDETQGVYKYHFYNPVTKTNFMNEKKSALAKFEKHFKEAVSFYKKDDKNNAYQQLGRAVHFMEDMNTPVHTAYETPLDCVAKLPLHMKFEKICDSICNECKFKISAETLEYYHINSLKTISNVAATLSADNFYYLENEKMDEQILAKNAIKNAQKNVSGILYKFFKEVSKT